MNEKQKQIAEQVRELFSITDFVEVGTAFTFSESLAKMIDGVTNGVTPDKMQEHFSLAWKAYTKMIATEHRQVVKNVLGDERFEKVTNHPNGGAVITLILERIIETQGGVTPGMDVSVDVDDIYAKLDSAY